MKSNFWYLVMFTLMFACNALANKEAGNGGGGVLINEKPYLLDLVESGIQANPFFNKNVKTDERLLARVQKALSELPGAPVDLVAQKLTEVAGMDRVLAASLLRVMEMYIWRATDFTLIRIPDEEKVISIPLADQIQLAARFEHSIALDSAAWSKLDLANKVALIFHEIIYALSSPEEVKNYYGVTFYSQSSPFSRELTAFLFSHQSASVGRSMLLEIIGDRLPLEEDNDLCAWFDNSLYCRPSIEAVYYDASSHQPQAVSVSPLTEKNEGWAVCTEANSGNGYTVEIGAALAAFKVEVVQEVSCLTVNFVFQKVGSLMAPAVFC